MNTETTTTAAEMTSSDMIVAITEEMTAVIKEALEEFANTSPVFNKTWEHDRLKTIGASEIGLCARLMYWRKVEGKQDDDLKDRWGARVRGTMMENVFWYPAMKAKFGANLLYAG